MIVQMNADPVIKDLGSLVKNLPRELAVVSGKTSKRAKSLIAKDVAKELAVPQKVIKKQLETAKLGKTGATTTLKKSARIPLKNFKARQTKAGVSYRISKRTGRKTVTGAFMGPKPGVTSPRLGNHVFKRVGKARLPIRKLYGPSPWGVFTGRRRIRPVGQQINAELRKQINERLRYRRLKAQGAI